MIVETIDFYPDEDAELPRPMTRKDLITLNRSRPFQNDIAIEVVKRTMLNESHKNVTVSSSGAGIGASSSSNAGATGEVIETNRMTDEERNLVSAANSNLDDDNEIKGIAGTEILEADEDIPIKIVKNYKKQVNFFLNYYLF